MSAAPPIEAMFDGVAWVAMPELERAAGDLPWATHSGLLELPGLGKLRVYRLSDGRAVFHAADLEKTFGGVSTLPAVRKIFDDNRVSFRVPDGPA